SCLAHFSDSKLARAWVQSKCGALGGTRTHDLSLSARRRTLSGLSLPLIHAGAANQDIESAPASSRLEITLTPQRRLLRLEALKIHQAPRAVGTSPKVQAGIVLAQALLRRTARRTDISPAFLISQNVNLPGHGYSQNMARSVGLEPTTSASAGLRSIRTELRAREKGPESPR